jgi:L-seryl-tRNA(Ser) seleniumtransferase
MTFRLIPSIEQLRQHDSVRELEVEFGHEAVVEALRAEAAALRDRLAAGTEAPADVAREITRRVPERLRISLQSLDGVINATGVIIHTNLGRAPLSRAAAERVVSLATGYTNLEYDVSRGTRGKRDVHAERLICQLTGAAAAVVVNNNAAATLLSLAALAAGREVLISRGELVEIGGGFRVPDVMAQSGAILREVGTTNRTRAADYAAALSDRTAMILRVHPSNFRIEGFTERPRLDELVALGRRFNITVAEDLGSGYLGKAAGIENTAALRDEPDVPGSIKAGADVVMFSGDKLLGGPQAGIIAGADPTVATIRRHPLMRALRVDKMTYAALEATLQAYVTGRAAVEVPVPQMISLTIARIETRARAVAASLPPSLHVELVDGFSTIGGGSAPGSALPTKLIAIADPDVSSEVLAASLRGLRPPVIARIENDTLVMDLRTVAPAEDERLVGAIRGYVEGRRAGVLDTRRSS